MSVPLPTPIYHLTHWQNLSSILSSGGLLSCHAKLIQNITHRNIAYDHIQQRREETMVVGAKGGCLHDYVPFHFAPKSPMLYTLSRGNVPGHTAGQGPLVYLVSTAQAVEAAGLSFAFTDGHAIMRFTAQYFDLNDLNHVDWAVMQGKYWNETPGDPDRPRRRQAEFLVYQQFPSTLISEIAVFDASTEAQVLGILRSSGLNVPVQIRRNWYY